MSSASPTWKRHVAFACHVGTEGAMAFARSPYLQHVESLSLSCNRIPKNHKVIAALKKRFGERLDV